MNQEDKIKNNSNKKQNINQTKNKEQIAKNKEKKKTIIKNQIVNIAEDNNVQVTEKKEVDLKVDKKQEKKEEKILKKNNKGNKEENKEFDNKNELEKNKGIDKIEKSVKDNPDEKKEVQKVLEKNEEKNKNAQYTPLGNNGSKVESTVFKVVESLFFVIVIILIISFTLFTVKSVNNTNVSSGISILGIDISELTKEEAINKVTEELDNLLNNNIVLKHNDFEANITPEQIEATFDIEGAVNAAFEEGTGKNAFTNSIKKLYLLINPLNIIPTLTINEEQLESSLNSISTQLPDGVIQSTYYIEDNNLIITLGSEGEVIDVSATKDIIYNAIKDLSFIYSQIELVTITTAPDDINLDNIYAEVKKEPVDAYYDPETYVVYTEQNGVDFDISLEEAKAMLETEQESYVIPLKTLYASITTDMIGMEAFPDLLASFSTNYSTSNKDRTTNLQLAAGKINGTVLLPGETFSYNTVVGERTIAAGYKEADMYLDGEVVSGLGGGICQISTTLYNAVLYANLEIVERRNHQFVPSYVNAGRDATVVYGSQDFQFKNNRNYAIKIVCSVSGGVAKFDIYGVREQNEYEVVISSKVTNKTSTSISSVTYKTLKQNGAVVSSEVLSRDTYKVQ